MSDDKKAEDSMKPPEEEAVVTPDIQQVSGNISNSDVIGEVIGQLIDVNEGHVIHEPTCLICSHPDRNAIEEQWAESKNIKELIGYVKEKTGLDVAKSVIENHMLYHLTRANREIQKLEYANKIKRLNSFNLSPLDLIKLQESALHERLLSINSLTPGGDFAQADIDKIKTQETVRISNAMTQLIKTQDALLKEMRAKGDVLTVPRESFIRIFNEALMDANNDREKDLINNMLDKISNLTQ